MLDAEIGLIGLIGLIGNPRTQLSGGHDGVWCKGVWCKGVWCTLASVVLVILVMVLVALRVVLIVLGSGKPLLLSLLRQTHPQDHQNHYQDHQDRAS